MDNFRRRIPRDYTRQRILRIVRYLLLALPIMCGVINQFRMLLSGQTHGIYIFVNPPGTIYPEVSLEMNWWITLVFVTAFGMLFSYINKQRTIRRSVYPLYAYILFLLILVKPV